MKPRAGFLKRENEIDKTLARFTKKKKERTQIDKIIKRRSNKQYHIDTKIIKYYEDICHENGQSKIMDKFLEK